MNPLSPHELHDATREGFSTLDVAPSVKEAALNHLLAWLSDAHLASYWPQINALIEHQRWNTLLDAFYQVLPFGTGGRRGRVGVGPNRFNPWTLGASVQGHAAFLRRQLGEGPIAIVLAYDVRRFQDHARELIADVPDPVRGMSSRDFAQIAAEVYAAADITVWMPTADTFLSTPELSFGIRHLQAQGGLNISASHNPPDDNGGKIYNATGGQEIPPRDEEMAREVESVRYIDRMPLDRARAAGLIQDIPPDLHEAYIAANLACGRSPRARSARIVFTSLHGTGRTTVFPVLQRAGFAVTLEPTQSSFDGAFPNVPFSAPNPEVPDSMAAAVLHAEHTGADIVMACDPDADRLGITVREHLLDPSSTDPVQWRFLSGNEMAALICTYLLSRRTHITPPIVFKTEVTSTLVTRVAHSHGAHVVGDLLVGFKYIGDALDQLERTGRFGHTVGHLEDFALGVEESHGVLVTTDVRDKDAAGGALILAELASIERDRNRTLVDTLHDLWRRVGYTHNILVSTVMRGARGRQLIQLIQQKLREAPPTRIGGLEVTAFYDRRDPNGPQGPILSQTDWASRDVLVWQLGDHARLVLRPSGTEPKNKVYVEFTGDPQAPLSAEMARISRACQALADDFVIDMLALVDITMPRWALQISDLVSVEHKLEFAHKVVPALVEQLSQPTADPEATGRWYDHAIAAFGRDARQLVGPGLLAYAQTQRPDLTRELLRYA